MSDKPKTPPPQPTSRELPAVVALRKKLDSIDETTLAEIAQTIDRVDAALAETPPGGVPNVPSVPTTGRCRMTVEAVGQYRNGLATDLNSLFVRFIKTLRANGHEVPIAVFANGADENVTNVDVSVGDPTKKDPAP